ncbi:hypothetical protein PG994_001092 [Apiospora phragmitis]|uniref:Uncharacterized protein n=1 Tax=Apiospora phragmitis TaxID=2905665 RepID=A0ABR1WSK0_9PEZI
MDRQQHPEPIPRPTNEPHPCPAANGGNDGGGAVAAATNAAQFSFGKPLGEPPNAPLPRPPTDKKHSSSSNKNNSFNSTNGADWLAHTEAELLQDLDTTKKELELIRTILWEMEMDDTSSPVPPLPKIETSPETTAAMAMAMAAAQQQRSQRKMLMAACREYAESRRQLLRERLRQVQFWTNSRDMGRWVPSAAPGDWALADAEWAKWLSDQAAAMQQQQQQSSGFEGEAGATWGPLPHILAAFAFSVEQG